MKVQTRLPHKVFVSDENGGKEPVIDARANRRVGSIDLGGEFATKKRGWSPRAPNHEASPAMRERILMTSTYGPIG